MNEPADDAAFGRIALLEQKLAAMGQRMELLEQTAAVVIRAEQTALKTLQDTQQGLANFEHQLLARRICDGLEAASLIYPKTRTVIFVGREYFGDNIKYGFLSYAAEAKAKGVACYFLTDSEQQYNQIGAMGLPCLPWALTEWTPEHMRIMLSAKVAVLSNIFYPADERRHLYWSLLRGAKQIQLWHGIPLKEVGLECLYTPPPSARARRKSLPRPVLSMCSSAPRAACRTNGGNVLPSAITPRSAGRAPISCSAM